MAELQERMSSREFTEWMAFYQVEPFGRQAEDLGVGIISATIANANKGKRGKTYTAQDFMPQYGQKRHPTWQQLLDKVVGINKALGGKDLRQPRE